MIPMVLVITFLIYGGLELTPGDAISHMIPPDQLANVDPSQLEALAKDEIETLKEIISHVNAIRSASAVMVETRHKLNRNPDIPERAKGYEKDVRSKMSEMREHIDALEMIIDDELWPLPKYRELLATL